MVFRLLKSHASAAILPGVFLVISGCSGIVDPEAEDLFRQKLGDTTLTIYPTYVRHGDGDDTYESGSAAAIGRFFTEEDLARVVLSEERVPLSEQWYSDQSRMLRESAQAFADYITGNPPATEYGLLAEYAFLAGSGAVGGIHCYILDASGRVAWVLLLNSHHDVFSEAAPQTIEDCTAILIAVLQDSLSDG